MRGHGVVILEGKYSDPLQLLKRKEDSTMATVYDPSKHYEIKVWDVEFRRDPVRILMARIYQPQGSGPFPALLDLHGGAWNNQDRTANAPMDESLAASGLLVVAIDLRRAPEAPYPASVQDANYGVRWLKAKAQEWNGDPATVAALGSSSGGHEIELCAMRIIMKWPLPTPTTFVRITPSSMVTNVRHLPLPWSFLNSMASVSWIQEAG